MAEYYDTMATRGKLVVIDFFATWCGPCRAIAPFVEQLASKYPNVLFAKVQHDDQGQGQAICGEAGIGAFPTFRFYAGGSQVDEMKGASPQGLEAKVIEHSAKVPQSFAGSGFSLGGGAASAESAREARLRRFGAGGGGTTSPGQAQSSPSATATPMEEDSDLQQAIAMSMQQMQQEQQQQQQEAAGSSDTTMDTSQEDPKAGTDTTAAAATDASDPQEKSESQDQAEMVLPAVDEALLKEVLAMEFPEVRARKALMAGNTTMDSVVTWLVEHGEDAGIDDPIPKVPKGGAGGGGGASQGKAPRSWRCVETGRLFRTMDEVQMYAEKTGRSNFEESTEEKKPKTAEEVAAEKERLKQLLAERRQARETGEAVDEIQREKQRRMMGKEMTKTREEMEKEKRMREYAKMKKEKEAARRERERLRAEIARDKAERKAHGGKLNSVLGAGGYNPAGTSARVAKELSSEQDAPGGASSSSSSAVAMDPAAKRQMVDQSIATLSKYTVGGDGGKALKVLLAYTRNIEENPKEEKFRHIKLENNAFKTKVAPLRGGLSYLKAIGFVRNDAAGVMELTEGNIDMELLRESKEKLAAAHQAYLKAAS